MLEFKGHYTDEGLKEELAATLAHLLDPVPAELIILGIGSERHILDCLGPLTGTMIKESTHLPVYGTLDEPLNAKNLNTRLDVIKQKHPHSIEIAIDASLASVDDLGMVKLFQGALQPGKALARRLDPVGRFYITGVVASQEDKPKLGRGSFGSISHVYFMARAISDAFAIWHNSHS